MKSFNYKKNFGQNFLINESIIDQITDSISPTTKDLILEIGCGTGNLTKKLKKYKAQVLGFEIDLETKNYLNKLLDDKTNFIFKDFLKLDIKKIIDNHDYNNLFIVGNLPYYITTPIVEKIIHSDLNEQGITIMVQKEVGDRFLSQPGKKTYGYFTVLLNYFYEINKICDVPKECFEPMPKINSIVLHLKRKKIKSEDIIDIELFQKLLKDSFQFKRKKLKNNLKNYDQEILKKVLNSHGYSLDSRAEEIDLKTFIELTKNI